MNFIRNKKMTSNFKNDFLLPKALKSEFKI